jgi:O-acetylserine/cysteine efflux transporter
MIIAFDPLVLRQPAALALILLSAFSQALASVLMRNLSGLSPMSFQGWSAMICLPVMVLGTLLFEQDQLLAIRNATAWHWAALAYTTVVASLVGHGVFYLLVQRHPVPLVMPYMLMMTPMAAGFGILVWGDSPGPKLWIGGSIILGSILFITLRGRARAQTTIRALEG